MAAILLGIIALGVLYKFAVTVDRSRRLADRYRRAFSDDGGSR
jgi:hypothetical protein